MKFLQLFISTYLVHVVNSTFEQCDENEKCLETENKYSKDKNNPIFESYLDKIHKAVLDYVPCNSSNCSCYFSNINNDLKLFKSSKISKKLLDSVRNKGTKYQIINHRLYREKDCMFPTRCSGIEYFLLKLVSTLPNMDLIINTRDWPQISKYQNTAPIFSFSKTRDYIDIMYPAWSFWGGGPAISLYPKGLGRWDLLREKLKNTAVEIPWEKKENKAFFRGSRTSAERDAIVLLSRESPNLVDAQYTKNQAWRSPADTLNAPPAEEVSFEGHCKYRYLFNFRGVAASFRFKHLFLCKSLVFHVGDEWKEFFYSELKPWVHYIPVNKDASKEELKQLIEFFMSNDNVAKEIAERGFNFIWEHLKFKDVLCYWKTLLKRYAKLLDYTPELDMSLNEIKKAS